MSISQVPNIEAKLIFPSENKSADFYSNEFAINNNSQVTFHILTVSSSSLVAEATLEFTLDGTTWATYEDLKFYIVSDDDLFLSLNDVQSFLRMRVKMDIISGSSIFKITARAV